MLFDFLDYVQDAFVDMCTGIAEDACQLGDELVHIYDPTYVSPYQKKHDAEEKITKSRLKFYDAQNEYQNYYKQVKNKAEKIYQHKIKVLGILEKNTRLSILPFSLIEFDRPSFEKRDDFLLGNFLGNFFGHELMDSAATSYLEDAKDYEIEIQKYCSKIDYQQAKLYTIENKIDVEEALLNTLESAIDRKNTTDKHKIAESIRKLLKYAICDSDGNISQIYVNEINSLRSLI